MSSNFKTRLADEAAQLNTKIEALDAFIQTKNFYAIDEFGRTMLNIQLTAMQTYCECLSARISHLKT